MNELAQRRIRHLQGLPILYVEDSNRPHVHATRVDGSDEIMPLCHAAWMIFHDRLLPEEAMVIPRDGDEYNIKADNLELLMPVRPTPGEDGFNYATTFDNRTNELVQVRYDRIVWSQKHGRVLPEHVQVRHLDGNNLNDAPDNLSVDIPKGS